MTRWRGNTVMLKEKKPNQRKQGKRHFISAFQPYRSSDSSWWMNFHGRGKDLWELLEFFSSNSICIAGQAAGPDGSVALQSQATISWLPAQGSVSQWGGLAINAFTKPLGILEGHHGTKTDFSPTQTTCQKQEQWAHVISWALSCFLCSLSLLLQARKDLRVE